MVKGTILCELGGTEEGADGHTLLVAAAVRRAGGAVVCQLPRCGWQP